MNLTVCKNIKNEKQGIWVYLLKEQTELNVLLTFRFINNWNHPLNTFFFHIFISTHRQIHSHSHLYINVYIYIYIYIYIYELFRSKEYHHIYTHAWTHTHTHTHSLSLSLCLSLCLSLLYIYIYIYVCVCVYNSIYYGGRQIDCRNILLNI